MHVTPSLAGRSTRTETSPAIRGLLIATLATVAASAVHAQSAPPIAKFVPPKPDPGHVFVLDSAHILSASQITALQDSAQALQAETGADIAWVTLPTLGGRTVEEAALYIGRQWRIGSPGQPGDPLRNRGLVVLYVPDKTKTAGPNFRIEVGKGLEGTITDSRSRSITTAMRDGLKAKTYDDAYAAGWTAAAALVREDFAANAASSATMVPPSRSAAPARDGPSPAAVVIVWVVILAVVVPIIVLVVRRRRRRRGFTPPPTALPTALMNDDDDERRRRAVWIPPSSDASSNWSSGSSSDSGSSSGGDFGGGGGFDGGGSSDTI